MLPRAPNANAFLDNFKRIGRDQSLNSYVHVSTMFETGSEVIQIEKFLKISAVILIGIVLLVVAVGLVNSLRMLMDERSIEIGTFRAIGLSRSAIRLLITLEMFFLASISAVCGCFVAVVGSKWIGSVKFDSITNSMAIFLENGRIPFKTIGISESWVAVTVVLFVTFVTYVSVIAIEKSEITELLKHKK